MKKHNLFFGFSILVIISFIIQRIEVPQPVLTAFAEKFPTAKKVEWEQEAKGIFEAEFEIGKKQMEAEFKADGTLICTETEIQRKDLPAKVLAAVKMKYPRFKIEEPEMIELPNGDVHYEMEVEKGKKEFEIVFDKNGIFVSEAIEEEDENDD